jgi:hypothetical protein
VLFANTRIRNRCFLVKWVFKIERRDQTSCCNLLRQKYLGERGIFSYKKHDGSQFWRGLMAVREDVMRNLIYRVGNGKRVRFWHEAWLGDCPLKIRFQEIFVICNQKEWSVFKVLRDRGINLTFRRNFGVVEEQEWEDLQILLEGTCLSQEPDSVKWCLEKSGEFSTPHSIMLLPFLECLING